VTWIISILYSQRKHECRIQFQIGKYLQKGTLQERSVWWQTYEWSRKSCHIRLQRTQPPPIFFSHVAKWRIRTWSPSHVENLPQGLLSFFTSASWGPTCVHPSAHMCSRHSIASLSSPYRPCSILYLLDFFFLCHQPPLFIPNP